MHRMVQMNFGSEGNDSVCMSNPETVKKYEGYYVGTINSGIFYLIDTNHQVIEFANVGCIITGDTVD